MPYIDLRISGNQYYSTDQKPGHRLGSREKFRRNIQKDATYGAGYFMEGQECNFVW